MRELKTNEIQEVSGASPGAILMGLLAGATYIGALSTFSDFGEGLGIGIYDATH